MVLLLLFHLSLTGRFLIPSTFADFPVGRMEALRFDGTRGVCLRFTFYHLEFICSDDVTGADL